MDSDSLTRAWADAGARLPEGWVLDGLRCASSGLTPDERSDDWIAVAIDESGEERRHRASDPVAALTGLADLMDPD